MERNIRQTMLPQVGEKGQERLKNSRVTVVGAGGLGSPVLTYLTEAGVGNIRIIDGDEVSLSNLNRQFLHSEADMGRKKTLSAKETGRIGGIMNRRRKQKEKEGGVSHGKEQ